MEYADIGNLDAQVGVMSRRLLALTWMMPPLIFPRSLQISRLLRAMLERGWETTAIAVPPDVEPFAARDPRLEQFYRGSYNIRYVEPREEVEPSPLWLRFARRVLRTKNTRDPNWIRRAEKALLKQIEIERPDAFVSFAQPWINHQVGLRVKQRHPNLPWVAHFSDPWVDSPYFNPEAEKARAAVIEQEKAIIAAADGVVFTTQETADLVMAKYPALWRKKVHIVPHGYDADLLDLIQAQPSSPIFTITHTGNLYAGREPFTLLRALAILRSEIPTRQIQLAFVGYATQSMRDLVVRLGLGDMVSITPSMPFLDSLAISQSADLLLVIDAPAEHSVFLPSKIVDYLSLRRPILALTPLSGASARVLGELGYPSVDPTDESGILGRLRESLARWQRGDSATQLAHADALRRYDIREVASGFERAVMNVINTEYHQDA